MRRTQTSTTPSRHRPRSAARLIAGAVLVLTGATAAVGCASVSRSDEPDIPEFTAPVVDDAGVVPDDAEEQTNQELLAYQDRSGNQIAVAIIETTGDASLEDYTIDLAKEWGVGSAEEDNGVVLLIAIEDRKTRIEVGEGIEGELTDLESGRIVRDEINPRLSDGEFGEAVLQGTRAIRGAIGDDTTLTASPEAAAPPAGRSRDSPRIPGWAFSVLPFVVFPLIFGRRRRRASPVYWGGGTVSKDRRDQRRLEDRRQRRRDDDDDDGSGWLGAAILGSILLGGRHDRGGGWGGSDFGGGGGGGFDFGGGGGGDFGGGGASGDW